MIAKNKRDDRSLHLARVLLSTGLVAAGS